MQRYAFTLMASLWAAHALAATADTGTAGGLQRTAFQTVLQAARTCRLALPAKHHKACG